MTAGTLGGKQGKATDLRQPSRKKGQSDKPSMTGGQPKDGKDRSPKTPNQTETATKPAAGQADRNRGKDKTTHKHMFNKPTIIMKQFKNLILAGALVLGLAGFAVSCDKYGDDIDSLQTQVDAIKADLQALQAKVDAGKYVTNVSKSGDGIVITWNDNSTSTIETIKGDKGDTGAAGTVVTIVDGYWAFDGVKSEYPAVGPKGEQGEPGKDGVDGTNGADGHDVQVSEDGYWMVWDAEAGEYVKTAYIAGGVRVSETTGGYNLTVRDENGDEQTIFVPTSSTMVGIEEVRDDKKPLDIFYGVVYQAVDWDGTKGGADKKMQTGMYPVLEEDVQVMLNPTGVDATAYRFDFRASDNKELWGLTFNDMVPYVGEKLLATRAVSSENGIWVLPREVARVELNELNARADYVTQFKQNNGSLYAFALNATSKTDASQVIKSQYIYSFDPKNIGVPGKDEPYVIKASYFHVNNGIRHAYVWNEYHKPDFKDWRPYNKAGSVYDIIGDVDLDQVIYDYKIEIDRTRMTQVDIDKYGLEISEDGYYFRTTKEASIDNFVDLKISFILLNGTKDTQTYRVYITAKDLVITDTNIGTINEPFNAVLTSGRYVLGAKELAFNPKEVLGANYDEWVDAMFDKLYNVNSVLLDKDKADSLKVGISILGGDPINNDATYNDLLVKNFLYIDYVDAGGKSCIYGVANDKVLSRLADIAALKVYFIAGTYHPSASDPYVGTITNLEDNTDDVIKPFYTVSGNASYNQGFAIPLDNAFSVRVAAEKEEYEVAAFTFKFQLTQPEIEKVGIVVKKDGEFTTWTSKKAAGQKTADVLAVYGAYDDDEMRLPMYEAFDMWTKMPYRSQNDNAKYFGLNMRPDTYNAVLFSKNVSDVNRGTLADIEYEANWREYETFVHFDPSTPRTDAPGPQVVVDINYHFFGVYPALPTQLPFYTDANGKAHPGFLLQYTSTIANSTMETKETIYDAHAGTHYVFISNDDIVAKTEKEREFVLFDGLDAKGNCTPRAKLNDARGFNEDIRPFVDPVDYKITAKEVGGTGKKVDVVPETTPAMPWVVNPTTSTIEPLVPDPAPVDGKIHVYLFPSSQKYPVGDTNFPNGLPAVEGGFVIQLGQNIEYRQPIEVTIEVKDDLGYSQNLKVVVQKLED